MPSSTVRNCSDPNDYAATIRGGNVEFTFVGRGNFESKLTRIDLHHLWMQRFYDNLPRIAEVGNLLPGRAYFIFRTAPGPSLVQGGEEIRSATIIRQGRVREYYQRSAGSSNFATMSLPIAEIAVLSEAIGVDLTPPLDAIPITPSPAALAHLKRLHAAAGYLADTAPEIVANPAAAQGLEQALTEALVGCLNQRQEHTERLARGQHAIVMRRFRQMLEERPEQPLYIPEMCKAIRVAERTLRLCCQEHLGMSPKRYLLLRRMHLVQQALRAATPETATVTEIAMRYGFWQLGRFAGEYRSLFGVAPSVTLQRRGDQRSFDLPKMHSLSATDPDDLPAT